jgi:hypothetical protein
MLNQIVGNWIHRDVSGAIAWIDGQADPELREDLMLTAFAEMCGE